MNELRFDGRVAVVTGAGGNPGLGRAYALLLASRGAQVVVNDIGAEAGLRGASTNAAAELVAREIRDAGGEAVADTNSVADEASAASIIRTALDAFGRIDIVVNNAGVCVFADLDEITATDIDLVMSTHVGGTIHVTRAAWPHLREQGYGRIINITSSGFHGLPRGSIYGAAKGACFAFTRSIAIDGAPHGIICNSVEPAAWTGMVAATYGEDRPFIQAIKESHLMQASLVAPTVALLAHESCPVSGECISSAAGAVARVFISSTEGIVDPNQSLESLLEVWDNVMDLHKSKLLTIDDLGMPKELFLDTKYVP